jgi:hypothetical protein
MSQKSVSTLISSVAAIMLAALTVSATAMVLSASVAEVNRQMDTAAIGSWRALAQSWLLRCHLFWGAGSLVF